MIEPVLPSRGEVPRDFQLPFQDDLVRGLTLRRFSFPGGLVDRSRAVVCVPGLAASGRSFARLAPLAARYDLRMLTGPLAVPYPGRPIESLSGVIAEYLRGFERPVLLGTSFGSLVALRAALSPGQRLRGLVLTAALASGSMVPRRYAAFAGALRAPRPVAFLAAPLAAWILGGGAVDREARRELVRESRLVSSKELYRRVKDVLATHLLERLQQLRLPVLLIHGTRDLVIPRRAARRLAAALPGAEYHEIRGAGHLPYLSHPAEFNALLGPFLDRVFAIP